MCGSWCAHFDICVLSSYISIKNKVPVRGGGGVSRRVGFPGTS